MMLLPPTLPEGLRSDIGRAASCVKDNMGDMVTVVTHYDGDGLASGAILLRTLMRLGFRVHLRAVSTTSDIGAVVEGEGSRVIIFSDIGSNSIPAISNGLGGRSAIILDHHRMGHNDTNDKGIILVNPTIYGVDGGREICASTLSFLFALALDRVNADLVPIAMAGAYGDRQYIGGWTGQNRAIMDAAISDGRLYQKNTVCAFGPDILSALKESTDPYIKGVSGRQDGAESLLKDCGISPDKGVHELSEREVKALNSLITLHLLRNGVRADMVSASVQPVLFGSKDSVAPDVNLLEANNLANACGRMGEYGAGIGMYLGVEDDLKRAIELRISYRKRIRDLLIGVEDGGWNELGYLRYIDGPEGGTTITGTLAGLAMDYILPGDKPTLVLVKDGDELKISARGTQDLVDRGLDLSTALRTAAERVGGRGGGHPIASGASIPAGSKEAFLEGLNRIIGSQIGSGV